VSIDIEDRLTDALQTDALGAPPAGDLLGRVRVQVRHRARRRAAVLVATVVTAVAATGLVVAQLPGGSATLRPDQPFAHSPGDGALASGQPPKLTFPLTPGWLPAGLAKTPTVSLGDGGQLAGWRDATAGRDGLLPGVDVWASDHDVSLSGDGVTRRPTTFDGHPAVVASTHGLVSLGWQVAPGAWRAVSAVNRWADEQVVRHIATELIERPLDAASPFTMTLVPRDASLVSWSTDGLFTFVANDEVAHWRTSSTPTVVQLSARRLRTDLVGQGDRVTVQGRPAWLRREGTGGRWTLVVQLGDQTLLTIETPAWDRDDVLRLGEATRYTGGVPQPEG
jgi:hypothetical protein